LTYQWRKDGSTLAGETNSTLVVANITALNAGQYSVIVSGGCGNVTSSNALLTVNAATTISVQPVGSTICASNTANFSVTASGQGTLTYQWQLNGSPISGATSSTLAVTNAQAANAGSYAVIVTGGCGSVTSSTATLVVNPSTAITSQPAPLTVCSGQNATFTVVATGTGTLTYQWKKDGVNITGNASATTSALALTGVTSADAATYSVVVSGGICGVSSVTSNLASILTVNTTPTVTANVTTSTTVCIGTTTTLTGGGASTYTWDNGVSDGNLFTPTATTTYTVTGTSAAGCVNTAFTTITVNTPAVTAPVFAGTVVWRGATSVDFGTAANWYSFDGTNYSVSTTAPTGTTNVIIPVNQGCVGLQPSTLGNSGSVNNITIEVGATLTMQNGTLVVIGDWINNGTFVPGTGTVEFSGAANQSITRAAGETFNKVTINKSAGVVSLLNNVAINNTLTLTSGIIDLQASDLNMASNTISGGTVASYVRTSGAGELKRNLAVGATTLFPIGRSTYNPVELVKSGSSHTFGVRVTDAVTANGLDNGAVSTGKNMKRMWHITPAAGYTASNGAVSVSLIYENNAANFLNGFINGQADRQMFHFGGTWENITSGTFVTGNYAVSNYFFCRQPGVTNFSPFTVSNFGTELPIELISFQANCEGDKQVDVTWSTASEHNTSHFVVEKSRDGVNWTTLNTMGAAGNSTTVIEYTLTDNNVSSGTTYYRLTQFDNDGASETFNVASVNCGAQLEITSNLVTYPNPSNGSFYVDFYTHDITGPSLISVVDSRGVIIYRQDVLVEKGSNVFHIEDLEAAPGMYYIQVSNGTTTSYIVKHSLR
jgi:hypothetical protein